MEEKATTNARVSLRDDGIVVVRPSGGPDTLATARENLAAIASFRRGDEQVALLIDFRGMKAQSREVRLFYSGEETARVVSAVAMIISSPLSRVIANFFLGIGKPPYPVHMVSDEEAAIQWLTQYLPEEGR